MFPGRSLRHSKKKVAEQQSKHFRLMTAASRKLTFHFFTFHYYLFTWGCCGCDSPFSPSQKLFVKKIENALYKCLRQSKKKKQAAEQRGKMISSPTRRRQTDGHSFLPPSEMIAPEANTYISSFARFCVRLHGAVANCFYICDSPFTVGLFSMPFLAGKGDRKAVDKEKKLR